MNTLDDCFNEKGSILFPHKRITIVSYLQSQYDLILQGRRNTGSWIAWVLEYFRLAYFFLLFFSLNAAPTIVIRLTLELFACKNSWDSNLVTMVAAGRRCIKVLQTPCAPDPPWRQSPFRICIVRSSRLSSGRRVIRLMSRRCLASATSALVSALSNVLRRLSRQDCTNTRCSEERRDSSRSQILCKRWRQF